VRPAGGHTMGDNTRNTLVLIDRLEAFEVEGEHGLEWEAEAWTGTDLHKLWLRTEGERVGDDLEDADVELLYGRSVAPWWDVVAGVRHHFEPGQAQDMAVLGVMGVAPYKVEVEASVYVGESGYTGARIELEYEALLTNRLILQPSLEVNVHGQDDRAHGNGSGLGMVEGGVRLRYEITRRFAPYVGFVHQRAYGRTADFRREAGEDANDTRLVAGVRVWF
jgi:copper resistance protein B